jgi:hypothetical protein
MILRAIAFLFLSILIINRVFACSCIGNSSIKNEISRSDIVAVGKIIDRQLLQLIDSATYQETLQHISDTSRIKAITQTIACYKVLVSTVFKGKVVGDTLTIYTGLGGGDCGVPFKNGECYVIYGQEEPYFGGPNSGMKYPKGRNIYWTDICSRTDAYSRKEVKDIWQALRAEK